MFPIRDDQPRFSTPYVNYFIIALNVLVFVFFELPVQFQGPRHFNALIFQFGFIPEHLTRALHGTSQYPISASLLTIFTSMFLHFIRLTLKFCWASSRLFCNQRSATRTKQSVSWRFWEHESVNGS